MKVGATNTYINARLGALLDAHGPRGEIARPLSAKLNYIMPAWDAIVRQEAERWTKKLSPADLEWLRHECREHLRPINGGLGAADAAAMIGSVLAANASASEAMVAGIQKHFGKATIAEKVALVWLLYAEPLAKF